MNGKLPGCSAPETLDTTNAAKDKKIDRINRIIKIKSRRQYRRT
jgi:hypothetical protein